MPELEKRVLVVGETLVDILTKNGVTVESPGGSPANVALGLGRLGRPVDLLTDIGNDAIGVWLAEHLGRSGVVVHPASVHSRSTSSARARIAEDGAASYTFDVRWNPRSLDDLGGYATMHTGSIAAFLEPGAHEVLRLMRAMRGREVTFDPNIRPDLIGGHADAVAAFENAVAASTVVKLSEEDAQWLYPGFSPDSVLRHIIDLGARLAVLTLGADGSILRTSEVQVEVGPAPVKVVDTIGAGDTYMAVLVDTITRCGSQQLSREFLAALGRRAAQAAAITVGRAGANLPFAAELDNASRT